MRSFGSFQVILHDMTRYASGKIRLSAGERIFAVFLLAFAALFVFVEMNNGKLYTNDFRVYYDASRDFFSGNNPYDHAYGLSTGFFKYPPFTLYLFGLISWMPYDTAKMVHLSLLIGATAYSFIAGRRLVNRLQTKENKGMAYGWLFLVFAVFAIHLTRELHMGNVNMFLVALFLAGMNSFTEQKSGLTAIYWSLLIILKPILIVALLPLLLMKNWKVVVKMIALGGFFLVFPIVTRGVSGAWSLWHDWFKAAAAHGDYLTSSNTVANILRTTTGFDKGWIVTAILFLLIAFLMVKEGLNRGVSSSFLLKWSAVFLAFIPNIFITDTEHFLYALPLVFLVLGEAIQTKSLLLWFLFATGMLCFSFHSSDLLGNDLSTFVSTYGLLGIGNLIFIGTFLITRIPRHN